MSQLYLFLLAVLARHYGIDVHAVVLMSTHEHLIVTDTRGCLPDFLRDLHRLFALGVKVLRKWEGPIWDHERTSIVELLTPEALIEKLAYVMANPVAAGLVRCAQEWPGIQTLPEDLGHKNFTVARPSAYLDPNNPRWPEQATLHLTVPELPGYEAAQIQELVRRELVELERTAWANVQHAGRKFVGATRVRKASPYDRAKSWEPIRGRNPQFAVGKGQPEAFSAAVSKLRAFRRAYRDALDKWCSGLRATCFPHGTWFMRVMHAAQIA